MEPQTYSAGAVVNYFLDNAEKYGVVITPMKLQKMLYFANGWSWAFFDKALIEEPCKAWEYGPVYPTVYNAYKHLRGKEISASKADKITNDGDVNKSPFKTFDARDYPAIEDNDAKNRNLLDNILKIYGKAGAIALSDWTHVDVKDNPWKIARQKRTSESPVIENDDIKDYFKRLKKEGLVK